MILPLVIKTSNQNQLIHQLHLILGFCSTLYEYLSLVQPSSHTAKTSFWEMVAPYTSDLLTEIKEKQTKLSTGWIRTKALLIMRLIL